jgi:hypothetical protein
MRLQCTGICLGLALVRKERASGVGMVELFQWGCIKSVAAHASSDNDDSTTDF